MTNDQITIPYKEYNAIRLSRVMLWIAFAVVVFFVFFVIVMLCLIGNFSTSFMIVIIGIAPFAFLCVSLLFLQKYRVPFFLVSFYLFALTYTLSTIFVALDITPSFFVLVLIIITPSLMAIFLTIHLVGKRKVLFAKWIAVAFALIVMISFVANIVLTVSLSLSGAAQASPLVVALYILQLFFTSAAPLLLFAYFGYKAYSDAYYNYFIAQPFSRVIREHTILFS